MSSGRKDRTHGRHRHLHRLSVALDKDEDTGELDYRNLTVQEADLRRECERKRWENVRVYTEHGVSAGKKSEAKRRVFYGELVRDIEAGGIDRVLFWAAVGPNKTPSSGPAPRPANRLGISPSANSPVP